jgi:hypothetical protein
MVIVTAVIIIVVSSSVPRGLLGFFLQRCFSNKMPVLYFFIFSSYDPTEFQSVLTRENAAAMTILVS